MPGLDALLGQNEARRRLENMIVRGRVPHALLFVGPAGVGKLRAALTLAEILMCETRETDRAWACGTCPGCIKVATGAHADVHRVTTTLKHLKIDDIRAATRALQLRPMEGRAKLVIVEGAERMTHEAQNALLKTLEEPPGTSYIVLLTSRLSSLLPTIQSRCQRVPFLPIGADALMKLVTEQRSLPSAEAALIAGMAQGSLAKALELDPAELIALRERAKAVDERLFPGRPAPANEAIAVASELVDDDAELAGVLEALLVWLHDQAVLASGARGVALTNEDQREALEALVEARGLRTVLERTRAVMQARHRLELPYNLNAQMIAEQLCLALVGQLPVPESAER